MSAPGRDGAQYGGLDLFRIPAALLVVAVHTGPLLTVSAQANYLITDILARLAVPFFLAVSGFFLAPGMRKGWRGLRHFCCKVLLLYGISILIYLPLMVRNGYFEGCTLRSLAADLVFNGPFYHLWYFPAAVLGAIVVSLLLRRLGERGALAVCGLLYLVGLLGDSYYGLSASLPPLNAFYSLLFSCFDYTRNGLFLAPLFLLLGVLLRERPPRLAGGRYGALLCGGLALLMAEGALVAWLDLPRHDSMYLALPLCIWPLMRLLCSVKCKSLPATRTASTAVYVLHPLSIVAVRGGARALGILSRDGFLLGSSLLHYLAVAAVSFLAALPFALLRQRRRRGQNSRTALRAWAEIDRSALIHNIGQLTGLLPSGCELMAVVKANAYGHGDALIARACMSSGVKAFAVATLEEGVRIRSAGIKGEVLILGWTPPEQARLLVRWRLTQAVVSPEYAQALNDSRCNVRVHLAVDTGMHRLGVSWDDGDSLRAVCGLKRLRVTGMFTHLAFSESLAPEAMQRTQEQLDRFRHAAELVAAAGYGPVALHALSSYGLLNCPPQSGMAYARPGIALYGVLSRPDEQVGTLPDLRPVLSLRARIARIHTLEPGDCAGYDGAFAPSGPARVAAVTIGYADGYPRSLSNGRGRVLIRGKFAPVAGFICMDQLLVDVTGIPEAQEGDIVTLIGRDEEQVLTVEEVAQDAGTITNELLSRLGERVIRVMIP